MRFHRWSLSHPYWAALAVLTFVGAAGAAYWTYWPSVPRMAALDIVAVDIRLMEWGKETEADTYQKEAAITSTNPNDIQALLDVLQAAQRAGEHKCGNSGT